MIDQEFFDGTELKSTLTQREDQKCRSRKSLRQGMSALPRPRAPFDVDSLQASRSGSSELAIVSRHEHATTCHMRCGHVKKVDTACEQLGCMALGKVTRPRENPVPVERH
jgi:hypothetical protein